MLVVRRKHSDKTVLWTRYPDSEDEKLVDVDPSDLGLVPNDPIGTFSVNGPIGNRAPITAKCFKNGWETAVVALMNVSYSDKLPKGCDFEQAKRLGEAKPKKPLPSEALYAARNAKRGWGRAPAPVLKRRGEALPRLEEEHKSATEAYEKALQEWAKNVLLECGILEE